MKIHKALGGLSVAAMLLSASVSHANQFYISGSYGYADIDDVDSNGTFTSDFTTGTVTGVNPPLVIGSGNAVEWDTDLDSGDAYSLSFGMFFDNFRVELEYAASSADIDSHDDVTAAGLALGAIDAGVLISGNVGDLGVSVADLVAAGEGEVETETIFVNGFYDFRNDSKWVPFVGVGIGYATVDVSYEPSNVAIIDDDDDVFAYQLMAGLAYQLNDQIAVSASLRYRDYEEATVNSSLLPAEFDIELDEMVYDVGFRYSF